ncbi:MAG: hypothetical protein DRJ38_05945, partial [Thermoprotei archaeon]
MVDILASITEAVVGIVTQIIEAIPSIFAALIVIGIGYIIGGIVGKAVN